MKLYVMRHRMTKCNEEHKYNGRLDEDINEEGINQAKEASDIVKKLRHRFNYLFAIIKNKTYLLHSECK